MAVEFILVLEIVGLLVARGVGQDEREPELGEVLVRGTYPLLEPLLGVEELLALEGERRESLSARDGRQGLMGRPRTARTTKRKGMPCHRAGSLEKWKHEMRVSSSPMLISSSGTSCVREQWEGISQPIPL